MTNTNSKTTPDHHRLRFTPWRMVLCLALFCFAIIEIQFSGLGWELVYRTMRDDLGFLDSFWASTEQFATVWPIGAVLIALWIYRPDLRATIIPFLIAALITAMTVNVIKLAAGRARPVYGWKMGQHEMQEIRDYLEIHDNAVLQPKPGDYWMWFSKDRPGQEIVGWITGGRPIGDRNKELSIGDYSSFPSGHASSAFLFAAFLSLVFPRAKIIWWVFGVGCALSRIRNRRHYPGDVLFGGAIGLTGFYLVFSAAWPFHLGARIEIIVLRIGARVGLCEPPAK